MSKLKAIIADDELDAIEVLSNMLIDSGKVDIISKIQKPLRIESQINKLKPDVLFLDIEMRGINGILLLENIREYNQDLPVIFITAYEKYLPKAAKLNIFSYLIKPIDQDELYKLIDNLICLNEQKTPSVSNKIKLPVKNGYIYLNDTELFYMEAEGNYTRINTIDGNTYMSSYNLGKLLSKLNESKYFRINRGMVLNADYIKLIDRKRRVCIAKFGQKEHEFGISQTFISQFNNN